LKGLLRLTGLSPGVTQDFRGVFRRFNIAEGRGFQPDDIYSIVLGNQVAKDLGVKAGDEINIGKKKLKVIGVLAALEGRGGLGGGGGINNSLYISIGTMEEMFPAKEPEKEGTVVSAVYIKAAKGSKVSDVSQRVRQAMTRSGTPVNTVTAEDLSNRINSVLGQLQGTLAAIAAISLLVGAIGVMNTMYTSVLERTREIGILKAVGAKDKHVLGLFLIESGLIGFIGGVIGIVLGVALSSGAGVEIINLFGNSTDLSLIGSGGPPTPTSSLLQWTSTELILSGLSFFEWLYFENTSKFSKKNGFDFTRFAFHIEPEELELIKFDLSLTVSLLATKMLLTTKFDLDIAFLYIYSSPLDIHGFIIPFIDLGGNELISASVALKDKLYKRKGTSHIDLKARDYYLDITVPDPTLLYEKTNFEAALSLEGKTAGLNFSGNLYFTLDNLRPVFITGEISYEPDLAREFSFTGGLAVDPTAGLQQLVVKVEWWFYGF